MINYVILCVFSEQFYLSHRTTKQQNDLSAQRRLRSAWASDQSDQSLRCPHEETLVLCLPAERTSKTLLRLGGYPGWPECSLGAHYIFVGFVMLWLIYTFLPHWFVQRWFFVLQGLSVSIEWRWSFLGSRWYYGVVYTMHLKKFTVRFIFVKIQLNLVTTKRVFGRFRPGQTQTGLRSHRS